MATLEELRGQLDVVDDQIVKLYEERMKYVNRLENIRSKQEEKYLTV